MHGCARRLATNQRCKRLYAEPWKRRTSLVKIWCTCATTADLDHRYLSDRWRRFMRRSANQTKGPKTAFSADDTLDEFACTESTSRDSRKLRRSLKRRSVQDESSKCDRSHRIELCVKLHRWKPARYAFTRLIILSVVMRASGRRERGKIYRVLKKREIVHSTCVRYSIESIRWLSIVAVVYGLWWQFSSVHQKRRRTIFICSSRSFYIILAIYTIVHGHIRRIRGDRCVACDVFETRSLAIANTSAD